MATESATGDDSVFLNHDVTAGFDSAIPDFVDLVVQQADVATALRALARLCFTGGGVGVAAIETGNLARWSARVQETHQEGLGRLNRGATPQD